MKSPKGRIIDLFTGRTMDVFVHDPTLDEQANTPGSTYLGVLPKDVAKQLRSDGQYLQARKEQIEAIINEWEDAYGNHKASLHQALVQYNMLPKAEHLEDQISIDSDGHVFLLTRRMH